MVSNTAVPSDEMNFDNEIKCGINALLKCEEKFKNNHVLIDDGKRIYLQVSTFKVPQLKEFVKRKISLKHPVYGDKPEVCLIVRDWLRKDGIRKTDDEMIDTTLEKYEDLINKHKITGITKIMPYQQLKTEYDTYELKRKLVNQFDIFLCSSYLLSKDRFFKCLGKIYMKSCKYPISVKLPSFKEDFDENANWRINKAIASTVYYIKPSSDNFCIKVGNTLQTEQQLTENLKILINEICRSDYYIPGGFQNIRSMSLKTEKSKLVPLYVSLKSANNIPRPKVQLNGTRAKAVEGEISSLPGKKVIVLPSGKVVIRKLEKKTGFGGGSEDDEENVSDTGGEVEDEEDKDLPDDDDDNDDVCEDDDEDNDDVCEDDDDDNEGKRLRGKLKDNVAKSSEVNEDEDDEDEIESAEQKYLLNLENAYESSEDEEQGGKSDEKNEHLKTTKKNKVQRLAKKTAKQGTQKKGGQRKIVGEKMKNKGMKRSLKDDGDKDQKIKKMRMNKMNPGKKIVRNKKKIMKKGNS